VVNFDVEGPVQGEVFVLWLNADHVELTGPCGPDAWYIEIGADEDPGEAVTRMTAANIGPAKLVHSTSWRRDRGGVILSFVVVIDATHVGDMASVPIRRAELARGEATSAPAEIDRTQVIEHGLRHLAWLAKDDAVVRAELSDGWHAVLSTYVPEPFQNIG
jgi:hypothetical protein